MLEGTILVPVLFALIFGVLEFSYYFYQQHLVSTGVRDAARYLARVQDPTAAAAQTTAQNLAATGSPAGGSYRRAKGFDPAEVSISFSLVANAPVGGVRPYRQSSRSGYSRQPSNRERHRQLHLGAAGLLGIFRFRLQERHRHAFRALDRTKLMTMRLKPLWGDERGGALLETTIMLTILLIFILGSVDFLMAMYQWNAAGKAVQIGARIAAVSTLLRMLSRPSPGLRGALPPAIIRPLHSQRVPVLARAGGVAPAAVAYNAAAMNRIVFGRTGGTSCTDATSPYEIGMCDVFPRVTAANVSVSYIYSGLGFAGRPGGPVPTVTVSLQNLTFQFFFLSAAHGFC